MNIHNSNAYELRRIMKLSDASRILCVPYQHLFVAVAAGRVPAQRGVNGTRWFVRESDLPAIAEALGVEFDESQPKEQMPRRSRKVRS